MKFLQKDYIKGVLILCLITILLMMGIMGILSYVQYREYTSSINNITAQLIGEIIQNHPELEEEIIKGIEQQENKKRQEEGKELLRQYGYEEQEKIYQESLEQELKQNMLLNIGLIAVLGIIFLAIFITYIIIKDRKIEQMTQYIKRVQKGDYTLSLKDNTEGELSDLRNEMQKVTIMLKEQAELLQKEKKQLENALSDISHQLKTPLTSISVMIDILRENPNVPEDKKREFLYEVTRQLEWINWLVISLLKLSKLDAGTIQFKKEKVNVNKLVREVVNNLSIPIELRNQQVRITGEETAYFIGDYHWSLEAVLNVVKNCLEHTPQGKKVDISFAENPLYTEIRIQDEGCGIAKEDLPHIFERFYKGKNASKDSVGIGLALAQSIVQGQGGDISVYSIEGKGSTFSIKWYKGIM